MIFNFLLNIKNKLLIFTLLFIFLVPWNIIKSQMAIFSVILFIWVIYEYKKEVIITLKNYLAFLPFLLLMSFIVFKFISTLWGESFFASLDHVLNFNKYFLLFIPALIVVLNKENSLLALKILIISFTFYSIYSILIYSGFFNSSEYGFQPSNPTGHLRYLIVSQYMVISFFVSILISYYSKSNKEKIFFSVVAILSLMTLFINNSRTAQLSFFIILVIFSIVFFRKKIFSLKFITSGLLLTLILFYFLDYNGKLHRYQIAYQEAFNVIDNNDFKGSFGLRLYFNKVGWKIFLDDPIFGIGPEDNREKFHDIQKNDPNYKIKKIYNHFHSEHIDTLTAYGLVGYSLLFFSIVFLIYYLRKNPLMYYSSLVVFLTLFINSFANKTLSVKPLNYVYIIFFVLFTIIAYYENKNLESSQF